MVRASAEREIKSRAMWSPCCWSKATAPIEQIMPEGAGEAVSMGVQSCPAMKTAIF